jgi:GxxExxY protein
MCLCHELSLRGIEFRKQVELAVVYKGVKLESSFFMDIVVANQVVVELKTVEKIHPIHQAQLLTYMKLSNKRLGLLLNFNVPLLKDGIKRLIL